VANLICWDALNVEGEQGIQRAAYLLDHSGRVGYSNSNNATFNATPHRRGVTTYPSQTAPAP